MPAPVPSSREQLVGQLDVAGPGSHRYESRYLTRLRFNDEVVIGTDELIGLRERGIFGDGAAKELAYSWVGPKSNKGVYVGREGPPQDRPTTSFALAYGLRLR